MQDVLDFGSCLTDEEYERRIVQLHSGLPPMPTEEQDIEVRRQELNLAIDHRLGCNFPLERRDSLWAIQQQVEKRRLRLAIKYLFRKLLPLMLVRGAHDLAGYMVDEYGKVLSDAELTRFFNLRKGERPQLPIDMNQLK